MCVTGSIVGPRAVLLGDDLHLLCQPPLDANFILSTTWLHNGTALSNDGRHSQYQLVGAAQTQLSVWQARVSDSGQFHCLMTYKNVRGVLQRASAMLNVTVLSVTGSQSMHLPTIISTTTPEVIFEGDNVSLFCDARWPFTMLWYRKTSAALQPVYFNSRVRARGGWLNISSVGRSDGGNLTCLAVNSAGKTNHTLSVHIWPGIGAVCMLNLCSSTT